MPPCLPLLLNLSSHSETPKKSSASDSAGAVVLRARPVSQWLNKQGFDHNSLEPDHLGVEQIAVDAAVLPMIAAALKSNGFDYLQCQAATTKALVSSYCFYHFLAMAEQVEAMAADPRPSCGKGGSRSSLIVKAAPRCRRSINCSAAPIGRSVKPSTCMASNLRGIRIPNG